VILLRRSINVALPAAKPTRARSSAPPSPACYAKLRRPFGLYLSVKQLTLDLLPPPAPTLSNFVVGRNTELLQLLHQIADRSAGERFVYLWGAPGAGKSHLVRAVARSSAAYLACRPQTRLSAEFSEQAISGLELIGLDDVDTLDDGGARDLFKLYNQVRAGAGTLVASGAAAPAQLRLPEDVKTRLGWGLVFQVHALSGAEKIAALQRSAAERGFTLSDEIINYLLTHWRRDMPSLLAALDVLDRYSLEAKRPVTVPLLKRAIAAAGGSSAPGLSSFPSG
jgi:DnaA family protein